jgi:hypothetical protein
MHHRWSLALAVLPVCAGLALAAGPTFAGTKGTTSTDYAFKTSGFGTLVIGGQLPVGSTTTGYQLIGCTNQAGKSRTNNVSEATLPGLGTASGIKTHIWTTSRGGVVASHSTHSIAELVLAQSQLGSLAVTAITSQAEAFHDDSGFHATTATRIGGLSFTPSGGQAQTVPLPTPDQPITVPGLATIYAGQHLTQHTGTGASADAFALRVDVLPTGASVRIAKSHAALSAGLTSGVFRGRSAATHVIKAGGDIVRSGPNPLSVMPCQGTYGRTREQSLASVDLGGQLVVKGATSSERGSQTADSAGGVSRAEVAKVSLAGQVVIHGVVGRASVRRTPDGMTASAHGTRLASVTVAGQKQVFPKSGVLRIPGVAELERSVVTRSHHGISVIGLRITLLDGSGAVIDLAEAKLRIRPLR